MIYTGGIKVTPVTQKYLLEKKRNLTYDLCCEGKPCSDTYFDEDKLLCVLTMSGETYEADLSKIN